MPYPNCCVSQLVVAAVGQLLAAVQLEPAAVLELAELVAAQEPAELVAAQEPAELVGLLAMAQTVAVQEASVPDEVADTLLLPQATSVIHLTQ